MKRSDTNPQCQAAKPYYYDYLCQQQEQIPEANSAHITGCPECLNEVQWLKQTDSDAEAFSLQKLQAVSHIAQMQLHCALIDQPVRCSTVKSFLPILAIPEMAVRISTPVTEHIKACAECARDLETLKRLDLSPEQLSCLGRIFVENKTERSDNSEKVTTLLPQSTKSLTEISRIIHRPDSGIVTRFRPNGDSVSLSETPFTVEVKKEPAKRQYPRQAQGAVTRPGWLFKVVSAAAAVLLVTVLLFQNTPVKATDIGQIYEALKNVQNVVLTHFEIDNPDPIQTTYISRSLGIKLMKTSDAVTLYDMNHQTQKNRTGPTLEMQQTDLDRTAAQSVAKTMEVPWGLLPFKNASELPDGAVWKKSPLEGLGLNPEQTEVYDLFWTETSADGNAIDYRWRCHLDASTKHPLKVEWWRKTPSNPDYERITFTEIAYPAEDQILHIINQAGF